MIDISVVLPAFNEGNRLANSVASIQAVAASLTPHYEIIIVNDGSSDHTLSEANKLISKNISVISYDSNQGKGHAVQQGMLKAKGRLHLFMDVDLATDLKALGEFYSLMRDSPVDVLIGDRKSDPQSQHVKQPYLRRSLGMVFTWMSRQLLDCPYHDFTCGFKMFTAEASRLIFSRQKIRRWSFDSEILFLARKNGLKVKEVPVIWRHQGQSKVRFAKDILSSLSGLLQIKWNDLMGTYDRKDLMGDNLQETLHQ